MSIKYEANFRQKLLLGYGKNVEEKFNRNHCHIFSLKKKNDIESHEVDIIPGEAVKDVWLFGPASVMDKSVIYPCSRHRCKVPCPCRICLKQPLTCEYPDRICCNCMKCIASFKDHGHFHATFHYGCKYCDQLLEIFPFFNFFFLNTETKRFTGTREPPKIVYFSPGRFPPEPKRTFESLREQHRNKINRCDECDMNFRITEHLKEHIKLNHLTGERFIHLYRNKYLVVNNVCDECEASFSSRKELTRHVESVHFLVKFDCDQCSATFTRKDNFERHLEEIHSTECLNGFICDLCNKFFARGDNYLRHKQSSVDSDGALKNKCSDCEDSFCTAKLLRDHSKTHGSELYCEKCGEKFTKKSSLNSHIIRRNVSKCDECEKTLCNKVSLQRHKFNAHNCQKCDQCDVVLKKAYMKNHKLWKH